MLTISRLDLFTLECINYPGHCKSLTSPVSLTLGEASTHLSALSIATVYGVFISQSTLSGTWSLPRSASS